MKLFITGTDTNIGKTVVASWLALHTGFTYFKPIQTGSIEGTDSIEVARLSRAKIYPEAFNYKESFAPYKAAQIEGENIDINKIILPQEHNLIIEGAGGLLVPINSKYLMIDLIKKLDTPVVLVASTKLGTINHTLLSLEALRVRDIKVIGVIMNGEKNDDNGKAIEFYGKAKILAQLDHVEHLDYHTLAKIPLPAPLQHLINGGYYDPI